MKSTLLDMTQEIMSSLNSDGVNSIGDTTESTQVAELIRRVYYNIINRADLPEQKQLFNLDASTDSALPVLMTKPANVHKLEWIKYDTSDDGVSSEPLYTYIPVYSTQQFLDMINGFNPTESNVGSFVLEGVRFYYKKDKQPQSCVIIRDYYIIFDSYNDAVDTTLESSKTLCYGSVNPTFTMSDNFIPDMDDKQFPLLINEAKSLAFLEIKQTSHPLAELESRRQWRTNQRTKQLNGPNYFDLLPNFAR